MKPVATMGEGKGDHSVSFQSTPIDITVPIQRKSKMVISVVLGIVTMVIIAITVALVMYFGHTITKDCYQDKLVRYPTKDGKGVEEIIHTTKEETTIIVPNKLRVIHNMKHNLTFYRIFDEDLNKYGNCVAFPAIGAISTRVKREMKTEGTIARLQYRKSNVTVASHVISDGVLDLCGEGDIIVMEEHWTSRVKRTYICTEIFSTQYYGNVNYPYNNIYLGTVTVDFSLAECTPAANAPYAYQYEIGCSFTPTPLLDLGPAEVAP